LLLNLYLTSITDIGSDTAIYINFGKKIAEGGRYYFDYFESNLPFNFYPYALFYIISQKTGINNIIIVQIAFYLMFFAMIYCSSKIIKKTTIFDQKLIVNFLFLSFFIGFLLRAPGIRFNEIGTKTSYLMLMLVPYLLYSFQHKQELSNTDKIIRGLLMALIPCFKPHYLIILISVESYRIYHKKLFFKLFNQLDYLVFAMFGLLALNWVIYFEREYFEFMVLMWKDFYIAYSDTQTYYKNALSCFIDNILVFIAISLIMFRYKVVDYNLKILLFAVIGSALTLLLEGLISIDQISVFFFAVVIFVFYLITNQDFIKLMNFTQRKFLICSILYASIIGLEFLFSIIFGINSVLFSFWIIAPILIFKLYRNHKISYQRLIFYSSVYFILIATLFLIAFLLANSFDLLLIIITCNFIFIASSITYYENRYLSKEKNYISNFNFIIIFGAMAILFFYFISTYKTAINQNDQFRSPNNDTDILAYYLKKYSPAKNDKAIFFSRNIPKYPTYNYLGKYNENKLLTFANYKYLSEEKRYDYESLDISTYSSNDLRKAMNDKDYKIIFFIDQSGKYEHKYCGINYLESLVRNKNFKKYLLTNFKFLVQYQTDYNLNEIKEKEIKINQKKYSYKISNKINNNVIVYVRK
jgi:hypothetical protein